MRTLDRATIELLTRPWARLPELESWLSEEVWTEQALADAGGSPSEYLQAGERLVNDAESLLTAAADTYFGELLSQPTRTIADFRAEHPDGCILVLDGCSLREIPKLRELAAISRRPVVESAIARSAFPSSTEHFITQRLGVELPLLGPSQLRGRRELGAAGITYAYFQAPNESQTIPSTPGTILLWHRFPDLRFMDSTATSAELYDGVWDTFELVWQRTIQALPQDRPVLVTSDHGYVFFGAGMTDQTLDSWARTLNGKRYLEYGVDEPLPEPSPGIYTDVERRTAALKGRCHNRPQAPSAAQSIYRHGGISLMEMLTPWLVLGPME